VGQPITQAIDQAFDRLRLIASGLKSAAQNEAFVP
jgi:hypothetical protein